MHKPQSAQLSTLPYCSGQIMLSVCFTAYSNKFSFVSKTKLLGIAGTDVAIVVSYDANSCILLRFISSFTLSFKQGTFHVLVYPQKETFGNSKIISFQKSMYSSEKKSPLECNRTAHRPVVSFIWFSILSFSSGNRK